MGFVPPKKISLGDPVGGDMSLPSYPETRSLEEGDYHLRSIVLDVKHSDVQVRQLHFGPH